MTIIESVFGRLRKAPGERIVLDQIAADAGVARSTIYAIFESRSGLFEAVGRELALRSGYEVLLEAKHQEDAREHVRFGLRAGTAMFAANREIYRALHSMAQLGDEAVGGSVAAEEAERARGMTRIVNRLVEENRLRKDLDPEEAERALWVLSSFETFDLLFTGRGLSEAEVGDFLLQVVDGWLFATGA